MTSPIGCHALVFTGEFDTAGIEQSAKRAARAGFDLIEYPLMDPFSFDAAAARRAVEGEGMFAPGTVLLSAGGSAFFDLVADTFAKAGLKSPTQVVTRSGCYLAHDSLSYTSISRR